jgi:outer membrane protein OmpA-like peptidoglycan-associated protein
LTVLIGAFLVGCASQTDRSSSGGADTQPAVEQERVGGTTNVVTQEELERRAAEKAAAEAQAAQQATPAAEDTSPAPYEPAEVQYIDAPLQEAAPAAAPAAAAAAASPSAADEALPDFPITKYEIEETDQQAGEVEDLGAQPDESGTAASMEEETVAAASGVSEPTEPADEPVEDLGTQEDESGTMSYAEESGGATDSGVSEPTTPAEPVQQAAASVSVNYEAEPLFGFDKAQVRNDQRKVIDDFVASLAGVDYDEVSITGHADQIGGEAYNQKLSERRADAVKAYLVNLGIPAGKIRTEGRGEAESVTNGSCKGSRGKALIACLQPDRRVDISVYGSKGN